MDSNLFNIIRDNYPDRGDILPVGILALLYVGISNAVNNLIQNDSQLELMWVPQSVVIWIGLLLLLVYFIQGKHYLRQKVKTIKDKLNLIYPTHVSKGIKNCFQGKLTWNSEVEFQLTNSESGLLLKEEEYKDFLLEFEFMFPSIEKFPLSNETWRHFNALGVIFRGQNLNNYFMLQLKFLYDSREEDLKNYSFTLLATPHVRVNSKWEVMGSDNLIDKIKVNEWTQCKLHLKGTVATLTTPKDSYTWNLPTNSVDKNFSEIEKALPNSKDPTKITFAEYYGCIGFRADGAERSVLRNVKISSL